MLHPNIIVIYDELESSKSVSWDWLLHSPVKFNINKATSTLITEDKENNIHSVAQLFSEQQCSIMQTDQYAAAPNEKRAERGENFANPWSLTASFGPSKVNRVLTVIQVETNEDKIMKVIRTDNNFLCGDWIIKAELSSKRPASLHIHNNRSKATFSYGEKLPSSMESPTRARINILLCSTTR